MRFLPFVLLCLCTLTSVYGLGAAPAESPRQVLPLERWDFIEEKPAAPGAAQPAADSAWQAITVPHIFRQSGLPDNTAGWYRTTLDASLPEPAARVFLRLDGAASVKDVYVNGKPVGTHKGAYSAAVFDLTDALVPAGPNVLLVRVSNRDAEAANTLSRSGLYFTNGGMFRPASIIQTGAVHFAPELGSSGVYLTPSRITPEHADLGVRSIVSNPLDRAVQVKIRHRVTDEAGALVADFGVTRTFQAGETAAVERTHQIAKPRLWDLLKPALYSVESTVLADSRPSDRVVNPLGFRTIAFSNGRFLLNGREVSIRGVNKHQQSEHVWNAVTPDESVRDFRRLAQLGVNAVRLAHYPHSDFEYTLADRLGLAVWAENGLAGQMWDKKSDAEKTPTADGERLTREMVRQNWNHPSILFWSCGNETLPVPATRYAAVLREEAPPGLITYASAGADPEHCDFIARNTYAGWYGGHLSNFGGTGKPTMTAETGAGSWQTHHAPYDAFNWRVNTFEPEEYAQLFTEYRLQTVFRDRVTDNSMFFWWTFREFFDVKFKNQRNTKGLLTLAGEPKDLFYLFQTFFTPDRPVVRLVGRDHFLRAFAADAGIKAYANSPELTLTLNGVRIGTSRNGDYRMPDSEQKNKDGSVTPRPGIHVANVFLWKTPLAPGRNVVEVDDGRGHRDTLVVYQTPVAPAATDLALDLQSSNAANPATFIDRPVAAQSAFYRDVDGGSDNTFDALPAAVTGASWIATRRLSDPALKTDLSFRLNPAATGGATVFVLASTGTHPIATLLPPDQAQIDAANALATSLTAAGFTRDPAPALWRDHGLHLADAMLWSRRLAPGESLTVPGHTLDYAVLLRP
jgi:beta-galactosidase